MDIDTSFFSLFRQMFLQGTVREMGTTGFTVYCCIKAHVDFTQGSAVPSEKELAEQIGLSERQIQRSLKALEKQGLLVRDKEGRQNVYRVKEKFLVEGKSLTWDHLPAHFKKARQELQALLAGEVTSGKLITVEKQTVNNPVFLESGDHVVGDKVLGTKINITIAASEIEKAASELEKIQDSALREQMESILRHVQEKAT